MCAIIGIVSSKPVAHRNWLAVGRDVMRHRGPDDEGEWWSADGRVGLGHRRLSIMDLSVGGHQPMLDTDGDLCIVFNGEIYNFMDLRETLMGHGHVFKSRSDTEVILAAYKQWGLDCLAHFNGMFAFCVYDGKKQQIFLARDRAGEKPLFYILDGGTLRFASELKGLMADPSVPRRIDSEALDCYLAFGYVPGRRCILKGFYKLPAAHALVFDLNKGNSRLWRYWELPQPSSSDISKPADEGQLLDELETLLQDAVRRQLIADVPVGVLLSGGVDSSLVTAMAVRASANIKTFTIRFPGYGAYDETQHARLIAKHFSTNHVELEASQVTVDFLPRLAKQFDEPIIDSSMIPTYLISSLIKDHCTVALGGDGGDELFGGYMHYNRWLWMRERLGWIPRWMRQMTANTTERLLPQGFKFRYWLQAMGGDFKSGLPLNSFYFDQTIRRQLMGKTSSWPLVAEDIRAQAIAPGGDLLQRAVRMDFNNYLAEDILVKVDRASMLNSLEIRSPFLDYRLIEFAFGKVPSCLKATSSRRKVLLKKLAQRLLPQEFDTHRKQGFSIPLGQWLRSGPWQALFYDMLLGAQKSFFNRKVVADLWAGQMRGRSNSERLFALVLFELWRVEYKAFI